MNILATYTEECFVIIVFGCNNLDFGLKKVQDNFAMFFFNYETIASLEVNKSYTCKQADVYVSVTDH